MYPVVPFMGSPQTLTQRLVPAFVVTLVATLVLGAVVVTADVADGTDPLLPASFGVASPQQGDAWRYNVTLKGDWTFGLDDVVEVGEELPFGMFQWAGSASVRGGDGLLHDANYLHAVHLGYGPQRLQVVDESQCEAFDCIYVATGPEDENVTLVRSEAPYWSEMNTTGWIVAGGREIVSRGSVVATYLNDSEPGFMGPPLDFGLGAYKEKMFDADGYIEYPQGKVPCLTFNPLQGNDINLTGGIALFDACSLGGKFLEIPEGLTFHAAAVETVSGVQAVRFDAKQNGTYQAWFTPGVPYPVRIEFQLPSQRPKVLQEGDIDAPGARSAILEMTGFAAGSGPLDLVNDPADPQPAPALVQGAPMTNPYDQGVRLGPDEADVSHPFPLSVAFQKALDAENFESLDAYLLGTPGVYMAAAEYMENSEYYGASPTGPMTGNARTWLIGLTDGETTFGFSATMQTLEEYAPTDLRDEAAQQPLYSFDSYLMPSGDWMEAPRLNMVPATLATARSLSDRWAAFDGSGLEANNWGFLIGCADGRGEDDPCQVEITYSAGHTRFNEATLFGGPGQPWPTPGNAYGTEQRIAVERLVRFDGAGTAQSMSIFDHRYYRADTSGTLPSDPLPLPPGQAATDPGYDVRSSGVAGIPSGTIAWLPEGREAASVTFMGFVIGALYWIWPKLGVVGLFSRLHRGELLDHPARAKLVQIVESQPGIHFHDLAMKAELANGTAVHHLRKLSDSGHISVRRSGRYTCYFPGGRVDPHAAAAAPLLKSEGAKQILEAVRNKPGMSNLELAQATGLQPSTVNYHVQRLSAAGLVAALRDGRNVRLHPGARAGSADPAPAAAGAA